MNTPSSKTRPMLGRLAKHCPDQEAIKPCNNLCTSFIGDPYSLTPDQLGYFTVCADDLFRVYQFIDHCKDQGREPYIAFLESTTCDFDQFKRAWEAFRQRFFRLYRASAMGLIERNPNNDGYGFGTLHSHLLVLFPAESTPGEIYGKINVDWRHTWQRIHEDETGVAITHRGGMKFKRPDDGTGHRHGRYICKGYNRGQNIAKFGRKRNQTNLIQANTRLLKLWQRRELPSRSMTPVEAVTWFRDQVEEGLEAA